MWTGLNGWIRWARTSWSKRLRPGLSAPTILTEARNLKPNPFRQIRRENRMAKTTEERALPYGLKATLVVDDEAPRELPGRDLTRTPHHEKCHCGKCPNRQKAA